MAESERINPDKALLRRYQEQGDLQAREQLLEQYMPLVRSLAWMHMHRGEQLEDLVQVGTIGLINAIERFDLSRGVKFITYAYPTISGEIKRHLRNHGSPVRVPRELMELNFRVSKLREQLTVQLGRAPTTSELAKAAGVDEKKALKALASRPTYSSLSRGNNQEGELNPLEALGTIEPQYELAEERATLKPALRVLDDRERTILHLHFFNGLTQQEIGRHVGLSQMQISRLIRSALEKIRTELTA